jgi:hypothetical protein
MFAGIDWRPRRPNAEQRRAFIQSQFDFLSKGAESAKKIGSDILSAVEFLAPTQAVQIQAGKAAIDDIYKEFEKVISGVTGGRLKKSENPAIDPLFGQWSERRKAFVRGERVSEEPHDGNDTPILDPIVTPNQVAPRSVGMAASNQFNVKDSGVSTM